MSCFAPGEAAPLTFDFQKESVTLGLYRIQDQISLNLYLDNDVGIVIFSSELGMATM